VNVYIKTRYAERPEMLTLIGNLLIGSCPRSVAARKECKIKIMEALKSTGEDVKDVRVSR